MGRYRVKTKDIVISLYRHSHFEHIYVLLLLFPLSFFLSVSISICLSSQCTTHSIHLGLIPPSFRVLRSTSIALMPFAPGAIVNLVGLIEGVPWSHNHLANRQLFCLKPKFSQRLNSS